MLNEERLQQKLGCVQFRCPPAYSEDELGSHLKVPYVRFPLWHYCSRCFRMKKAGLFGPRPVCDNCKVGTNPRPDDAVPNCGHLRGWAHRGFSIPYMVQVHSAPDDYSAKLYFKAGRSSASLAGIKIECGDLRREKVPGGVV